MSTKQQQQLFTSLEEFLSLPGQENDALAWQDNLTTEQFYAIVLAYNDKFKGKKREIIKNGLGKKVYSLSAAERQAFMCAYKSDRTAAYSIEEVRDMFADVCAPEIAQIVSNQTATRAEKLALIHNIVVSKVACDQQLKDNQYGFYFQLRNRTEDLQKPEVRDLYARDCEVLDQVSDVPLFNKRVGERSLAEKQQVQQMVETLIGSAIDGIFVHTLNSVSAVVDSDAYAKAKLASEGEAE